MNYERNQTLAKIQSLLNQRGWSVYKLSKRTGITYSSLNSMFRKNTQPTLYTLEKICAGLDISLAEFFFEDTPYREKKEFSTEELEMIDIYHGLNKKEQIMLLSYIRGFSRNRSML